ncbi:MAG: peptidase [Sphingomonadaceae bacterium]|uniref:peptidase n=1 Tax=Thermaurantiacus sp. TaxID=2820283 RepID=UPI00298F2E2F|nr:peptidase [Thermaurantiacus sp.]MCS6987287.1 peptidase [Sphingomonadaceae bacterium]MDW8414507.1 peptidase [Thermaurantiacus sp.]
MTYCLGILVRDGLVMLTDSRTNAGIDMVSHYRKLRVFGEEGKRIVAIASAGSLSVTQAAINRLNEGVEIPGRPGLHFVETAPTMFRVAEVVGHALRQARREIDETVQSEDVQTGASFLVGGSIGGKAPTLFLIYGEGNFIECGMDTPYLQIGELKYGKPILDRLLTYRTPLPEALKVGLLSMNSTIKSNLSVGLPIDLLVLRPGHSSAITFRIEEGDPYYQELGLRWQLALQDALDAIPDPPYLPAAEG